MDAQTAEWKKPFVGTGIEENIVLRLLLSNRFLGIKWIDLALDRLQ
jgi:hypothetical protein